MPFEVTLKFVVAAPDKFVAELHASNAAEMLYVNRRVFCGVGLVTETVEEKSGEKSGEPPTLPVVDGSTAGRCGDCAHWRTGQDAEWGLGQDEGACAKASSSGGFEGEYDETSLAYAAGTERCGGFVTKAAFGCVQFKPKVG